MTEYGLSLLVIEPEILPTIYSVVAETDLTDAQARDVIEGAENVPEGFVLVEDIPETGRNRVSRHSDRRNYRRTTSLCDRI